MKVNSPNFFLMLSNLQIQETSVNPFKLLKDIKTDYTPNR